MNPAYRQIVELARRDTVDPIAAAEVLALAVISVEQVTRFRREYQLGTNDTFIAATAIVGGRNDSWRVVDLVPRDLVLAPLAALLAEAPYAQRWLVKHTPDGPVNVGIEHRFAVSAGELVVTSRAVRIESITLTNERTLQSTAPSLALQRRRSSVLR